MFARFLVGYGGKPSPMRLPTPVAGFPFSFQFYFLLLVSSSHGFFPSSISSSLGQKVELNWDIEATPTLNLSQSGILFEPVAKTQK